MKNKTTAGLLAILLGWLWIHKFYLSHNGQWILYLLFCWTFIPAILWIIEGIIYLSMSDKDFDKKYNHWSHTDKHVFNEIEKLQAREKLDAMKEKGTISDWKYKELISGLENKDNLANKKSNNKTILIWFIVIILGLPVLQRLVKTLSE